MFFWNFKILIKNIFSRINFFLFLILWAADELKEQLEIKKNNMKVLDKKIYMMNIRNKALKKQVQTLGGVVKTTVAL